jgi:catechol 2,3-dioxygenase-like lactoylglutathione lyase family enzyme
MTTRLSVTTVKVLDQDEALDFYVNKLGLEVRENVDLGFMRWVTVCIPGDPSHAVLLERPAPPSVDESSAEQLRELITKGAAGWVGFNTEDCRKTHEELSARGVEFIQEPMERDYGIDCALRDPFGNQIRIVQPKIG